MANNTKEPKTEFAQAPELEQSPPEKIANDEKKREDAVLLELLAFSMYVADQHAVPTPDELQQRVDYTAADKATSDEAKAWRANESIRMEYRHRARLVRAYLAEDFIRLQSFKTKGTDEALKTLLTVPAAIAYDIG